MNGDGAMNGGMVNGDIVVSPWDIPPPKTHGRARLSERDGGESITFSLNDKKTSQSCFTLGVAWRQGSTTPNSK